MPVAQLAIVGRAPPWAGAGVPPGRARAGGAGASGWATGPSCTGAGSTSSAGISSAPASWRPNWLRWLTRTTVPTTATSSTTTRPMRPTSASRRRGRGVPVPSSSPLRTVERRGPGARSRDPGEGSVGALITGEITRRYVTRPCHPPVSALDQRLPPVGPVAQPRRDREHRRTGVLDVLHHLVVAGQRALHGHELAVGIAHERHEEQAGVEVAQPVAAVDEVVAAAQDARAPVVLGRGEADVRVRAD